MARTVGRLLAAGLLLVACGGHTEKPGQAPHGAGASPGSGAEPGMSAAPQGGSGVAGSSSGNGAAGTASFVAIPVGTEPGVPPGGAPPWLTRDPSTLGRPLLAICSELWTLEQAQDALTAEQGIVDAAEIVDVSELEETLDQLRELPLSLMSVRLVAFFPLSGGETGAAYLGKEGSTVQLSYFRIAQDCTVQLLSTYYEDYDQVLGDAPCTAVAGFPMWGMPARSERLAQCQSSAGYYAFDAEVTEDSCAATPLRFTGIFGYWQQTDSGGSLWFQDLAGHPAGGPGYDVRISERLVSGSVTGCIGPTCDCQRHTTTVDLVPAKSLDVSDQREVCDDKVVRDCSWQMHSDHIYGPLQ